MTKRSIKKSIKEFRIRTKSAKNRLNKNKSHSNKTEKNESDEIYNAYVVMAPCKDKERQN